MDEGYLKCRFHLVADVSAAMLQQVIDLLGVQSQLLCLHADKGSPSSTFISCFLCLVGYENCRCPLCCSNDNEHEPFPVFRLEYHEKSLFR